MFSVILITTLIFVSFGAKYSVGLQACTSDSQCPSGKNCQNRECVTSTRFSGRNTYNPYIERCRSDNECANSDIWAECCFDGICDRCDMKPYPTSQKDFNMVCKKNNCICKGYPNPNYREPLLKGKVTLEQCSEACRRRTFCFGFEFWDDKPANSANCFECPTFPNKKYTIKVIASSSLSSRSYSTVFQKIRTDMQTNINPQCVQELNSCGRWPGGRCCANLKCIQGTCKRQKECWLSGEQGMSCPKGWYCSGIRGGCRKCQVRHNKEPSKCRNNYLGGQCTADDQKLADINDGKQVLEWFEGCASMKCKGKCAADCMIKHGFSQQCHPCFVSGTDCLVNKCWYFCGPLDPADVFGTCKGCAEKKCMPGFITCSGLSFPLSDKLVEKLIEEIKDPNNHPKSR